MKNIKKVSQLQSSHAALQGAGCEVFSALIGPCVSDAVMSSRN